MKLHQPIRLTSLAHGGGCGCKLAPSVLRDLLQNSSHAMFERLLVGNSTGDDAAVWQLDERTCVLATTDSAKSSEIAERSFFLMPTS